VICAPGSVLVSATVCVGGLLPFCVLTLIALGLAFSSAVLLTLSVIGTFNGELAALADVIEMFPLQVPGAPSGLDTVTVITTGVVPLGGVAEAKFPHADDELCVATVTGKGGPLLVTVNVCATGGLWNSSRLNTSAPWLAFNEVELVTFSTTRYVGVLPAPCAESAMVDWYLPGANPARTTGSRENDRFCGVTPLRGLTTSQLPPLLGVICTRKLTGLPVVLTPTDCCMGRVADWY